MEQMISQPIQIKGMALKNRIAFAPFYNMPATRDGRVCDLTIRWFEKRAQGGAGFLMMGGTNVTPFAPAYREFLQTAPMEDVPLEGLVDDSHIPEWAKLAEKMHSYDCKIGMQLGPPGVNGGNAPSPPPYPSEYHSIDEPTSAVFRAPSGSRGATIPEMSIEQIEEIIHTTAAVAARVKAAGLDCVEVHAGHSITLAANFLTPYYNRRTDKYGGDWKGRVRFTGEMVRAIKDAVGEDFPVSVRFSAEEYIGKWGVTIEDSCKYIVPELETYGVDCFSITQGIASQTLDFVFLPTYFSPGAVIDLPAAIKKVTTLPVFGVGKIVDMEMAEQFLQEDKADIIYMGRQLMADPDTPRKYFEGRSEETRRCIGDQVAGNPGVCGRPCVVNYDLQDEPIPLVKTEMPKKILVIGGGVAGMEASRILAERGHQVTLMEKEAQLGGIVETLSLDPLMASFGNIIDYLSVQMRKLKVDVRVCKEATAADVEALKPDAVILATGSSLAVPAVAEGAPKTMTHLEALRQKDVIGQRVVIWGFPGTEYAISLAEEGKDVTLIGGGEPSLAAEVPLIRRLWVYRKVTDHSFIRNHPGLERPDSLETLFNVKVKEIAADGIRILHEGYGEKVLPYDTLIISRGRKSNDALFDQLQEKVPEIHKIGDCRGVKDIRAAVWAANEVAREI